MQGVKAAAFALAALLATGCTTMSLEELRRTTPQGTEFQKALAQRYMDFAIIEAGDYDWLDSMYFADKGLLSAYGKDTAPEDLDKWRIPESVLPDLMKARETLMRVLTPQIIEAQPQLAADAQFYFDCWVEQQEENWQWDDIARCRDGLAEALEELTGAPMKEETPAPKPVLPAKPKPAPKPVAEKVPEPPPPPPAPPPPSIVPEPLAAEPVPPVAAPPPPAPPPPPEMAPQPAPEAKGLEQDVMTYVVFFEESLPVVSESGRRVIDEVINVVQPLTSYEVVLNSHTDTLGDSQQNQELSQRRAELVRQLLVEGGVSEGAIKIFAFGESDPPVKTPDEVREPANQRVEILLNE